MRRILAGLCLLIALVTGSSAAMGAEPEYATKAKIMLMLLPYVQWPSQEAWGDRPFQVAILGKSPFGSHLDEVVQKLTVHHKSIQIRYTTKLNEAEGCQVLFICDSEAQRVDAVLGWTRGKPILTVTDDEAMACRGVMVNLILEGRFVRLAVNPEAANASGIFLGSQLLRNARILSTRRSPS
jgi:hypothetical protein